MLPWFGAGLVGASKATEERSERLEDLLLRLRSSVPGVGLVSRLRLTVDRDWVSLPELSESLSNEGGPEGPA